jgi:N-acetylmuramoyl-L-alanine amidase
MRNSTDASLTESLYWQGLAADAIAAGLETYLTSP